jgi:hypothetical protein
MAAHISAVIPGGATRAGKGIHMAASWIPFPVLRTAGDDTTVLGNEMQTADTRRFAELCKRVVCETLEVAQCRFHY